MITETDTLKYAGKLNKNARENQLFSESIDNFRLGKLKPNEVLRIGTTPNCLRIIGAQAIPIIVTQSVIANSMETPNFLSNRNTRKHTEQHNIPIDTMKKLPQALRDPILICEGNREKSIVIITELKNKEHQNIIVPIELSVKGRHGYVNKISTIHGKKNIQNFLSNAILSNKILALNKEKADLLCLDKGIQSSQSTTVICFDSSIAYTLDNVKYPSVIASADTISSLANPSFSNKHISTGHTG